MPLIDLIYHNNFPLKEELEFWRSAIERLKETHFPKQCPQHLRELREELLGTSQERYEGLVQLESTWLAEAYDCAISEAKDPASGGSTYQGKSYIDFNRGNKLANTTSHGALIQPAADFLQAPASSLSPVAVYLMVLVMIIQVFGKLAHSWCQLLLVGLAGGFRLFGQLINTDTPTKIFLNAVSKDVPTDLRTVKNSLQLTPPPSVEYATCPNTKCSKIYAPSSAGTWPTNCNPHISHGKNVCHERLLRRSSESSELRPIRPFVAYDVRSQIAEMAALEPSASKLYKGYSGDRLQQEVQDILQAGLAREFPGPTVGPKGTMSFFDAPDDEGRYLFTLSVDWMNPFGKKAAGVSSSIGIISLACVNLPMNIRYKPENLILAGVIPGPREPALDSVNHFLMPLVNNFLDLWSPGVTLTGQGLNNTLIRAAILAFVADLPASRKVAGNAGHSANAFCSLCTLKKDNMDDLDIANWGRYSCATHRNAAFSWLHASSSQRAALYKETGIRWSPLFLLPYWDPTRQVVVDMMHDMFLGVIKRHFLEVLGMSDTASSKVTHHTELQPDEKRLKKARKLLNLRQTAALEKQLSNHRWIELYVLCEEAGLRPSLMKQRTKILKKEMVEKLANWVRLLIGACVRRLRTHHLADQRALPHAQ